LSLALFSLARCPFAVSAFCVRFASKSTYRSLASSVVTRIDATLKGWYLYRSSIVFWDQNKIMDPKRNPSGHDEDGTDSPGDSGSSTLAWEKSNLHHSLAYIELQHVLSEMEETGPQAQGNHPSCFLSRIHHCQSVWHRLQKQQEQKHQEDQKIDWAEMNELNHLVNRACQNYHLRLALSSDIRNLVTLIYDQPKSSEEWRADLGRLAGETNGPSRETSDSADSSETFDQYMKQHIVLPVTPHHLLYASATRKFDLNQHNAKLSKTDESREIDDQQTRQLSPSSSATHKQQQQQQQQRRTWATIVYCLICFGIVRIAHTLLQSPSDESMTPTPMAETASSTEEMSAHADPKVDHGANRSLEEGENSQPTKNNPGDSNSSLRMIDSVSDVLVAMEITNSQPMANNPDNSNSSLGMIDSVEDAHSQPTPNNSDESSSSLEQINSVVEAMGRENSQPTANSSGDSNPSIGKIGSLPDANEGDSASITNVVRTDNGSNFEEGVNPSLVDSIVHDKSPVKEDTNLPQHDPLTSTSETAFVNTAEMQAPAATSSSELMQGKESSEQATEFDSASVGFLLVVVVAFLYQLFVGKRPSKSDSPLDLQQKSSDSVEGGGNQQSIQKEDKQIFVLTVVVPDVIRRPSNEVRDEWRPFVADTGDEGDSSRTVAVNLHFLAVNTMNGFIRRSKLSRSSVYMAADSRSNSTSIQVVSVSSEKMQELVDEFSILGIGCSVGMMYASRAHSMYTRTTKANEGDDDASLLPTLSHASALWQHGENLVEPRSLDNEDLSVSTSDSFRYKSSVASVGSNRGDVAYVGSLGEQREEATPKHGNSSKHSRIPSVDGGKSEEIGPEHEIVFAPSHADSDDDVPGPLFTVQLGETDGKTTQHSDDTPPAPSNAVASPPWTLVKKKRKHHGRKAATLLTLFLPTSGAFRWNALPSVSFVNSSKGAIRYNGLNSRSQSGVKMVSSEKSDPIVSGQKIGVRAKAVVIGVMGGIGAGKSTACRMLSEVIPVGSATVHLEADIIARDLYKPGSELVEALAKEFGTTVIAEDGQINRPALADIIFKDNEARHRLEQIVWPLTKQEILRQIDAFANEWNANKGNDTFFVAVLEAAMLLDAGWEDMLDELWVVTASADIAFQRLVGGERGLDPDDARRRMTDQESRRGIGNLNEEVERGFVTAVVDNSGTTADLRRSLDNTLKDVVDKWQKSRGIETN